MPLRSGKKASTKPGRKLAGSGSVKKTPSRRVKQSLGCMARVVPSSKSNRPTDKTLLIQRAANEAVAKIFTKQWRKPSSVEDDSIVPCHDLPERLDVDADVAGSIHIAILEDDYADDEEGVGKEVVGHKEEAQLGNEPDIEEDTLSSKSIRSIFDPLEMDNPLVGAPIDVQDELDSIAIKLQRKNISKKEFNLLFNKIVFYINKYVLGLVFKKYSFVMGNDESDMYEEALIALFRKAIPSFRRGKGMSFLNFAKMCINRHLITILHASRHRCKDIPINTAISLDHNPMGFGEDDDSCLLSNVVVGVVPQEAPSERMCREETIQCTVNMIHEKLSKFEKVVLREYLEDNSYRDSAQNISRKHSEKCNEKSIDNALLRIRKKADDLKTEAGRSSIPLFA